MNVAAYKKGDIIHIPSDTTHFIDNTGEDTIIYISASVPAYNFEALYDEGELRADQEELHDPLPASDGEGHCAHSL